VSNTKKERSADAARTDSLEAIFDQLERKLETLASNLRAAQDENAKLKAAAGAAGAERERMQAELSEARSAAGRQGDTAERLKRLEAERDEIRARVERLIGSLEGTDAAAGPSKG
jgi:outer membrane murein-binding lipoprotein Lpp